MNIEAGTLYIVATPIGNLADMTDRGREVLSGVEVVYAEDTRTTRTLLQAHKIKVENLRSYREAASRPQVEKIITEVLHELQNGAVAYVSDAGTPGISDPGDYLVQKVREAGHAVVPIPGASTLTALLSVAGQAVQHPLFEGFLPHKKGRSTRLKQLSELLKSGLIDGIVLFESPHRFLKLLEELSEWPFEPRLCVGRELTKFYEDIMTGSLADITNHYKNKTIKGEIAILITHG